MCSFIGGSDKYTQIRYTGRWGRYNSPSISWKTCLPVVDAGSQLSKLPFTPSLSRFGMKTIRRQRTSLRICRNFFSKVAFHLVLRFDCQCFSPDYPHSARREALTLVDALVASVETVTVEDIAFQKRLSVIKNTIYAQPPGYWNDIMSTVGLQSILHFQAAPFLTKPPLPPTRTVLDSR